MKIHFSDDIPARKRKLHLQTQFFEDPFKMVSTLFEDGQLLHKEEKPGDSSLNEDALQADVETYHFLHKNSIARLYQIRDKVEQSQHALSYLRLGRQFLKWQLLDEATEALQTALRLKPALGHAYVSLIDIFLVREKIKEASETAKTALSHCPAYADIHFQTGKVRLCRKKYIPAMQSFVEALKINPTYNLVHLGLSGCFLKMLIAPSREPNLPSVEECMRRAKKHFEKARTSLTSVQGDLFEKLTAYIYGENHALAFETLWHFLLTRHGNTELNVIDRFYLHFLYGDHGKDSEVIQDYVLQIENFARKHPGYADLHEHLGVAKLIQCRDDFNIALQHFKKAKFLNPNHVRYQAHMEMTDREGHVFLDLLKKVLA